jgi:K+-sensing histidine kinase KdpD
MPSVSSPSRPRSASNYLAAAAIVAACTALSGLSHWGALTEANMWMIFLAGTLLTALRFGHGPAMLAFGLSAASMSFFFLHPKFEFQFSDKQYFITIGIMGAVGVLISQIASRLQTVRRQVEVEQLRNSLLTSISHDLRSPLATIAVTTSELLEGSPEQTLAERRDVLETIVDETRQLGRQIDNLLDMGRLNTGDATLTFDWNVLEELVGVALARLRRELAGRNVTIDLPSDLPLVWAAGDLLVQVLINLLENASRYTPPGSCIEIRGRSHQRHVELTIADNGPGLPSGSEEAIFGKFVRGTTAVADGRRGMGLGLAICRHIMRAHGGDIAARNGRAGGAEFVMTLRCRERSVEEPADDDALIPATAEPRAAGEEI